MPDEAVTVDPTRLTKWQAMYRENDFGGVIKALCDPDPWWGVGWPSHAVLSGHARVLAVGDFVLATPLYLEYAVDTDLHGRLQSGSLKVSRQPANPRSAAIQAASVSPSLAIIAATAW